MAPNNFTTALEAKAGIESALWRLGPAMARVAAETAGAFISAEAMPGTDWTAVPRLPDLGQLRCSQKNIGEKHEMVINFSVEKAEWQRLFPSSEGEEFIQDAFCELANCICGSLIAEPGFTDEFGYLIPCVPYAGHSKVPAPAPTWRGAFRLGGAWIHFSVSVGDASGILSREAILVA